MSHSPGRRQAAGSTASRAVRARARGYSIIELMTVVLIVAITVTFGLPSFLESLRNNRVTGRTNELVASAALARSEAIKRAANARLCVSSDGATCTGSDWDDGWLVIADFDRDGSYETPSEILRVVGPNADVETTATRSGVAVSELEFNNRGFLLNAGAPETVQRVVAVSAKSCPVGDRASRALTVAVTGRISVTQATCS